MLRVGVQSAGWYSKDDPDGSFAYIKSCGFNAIDFNIDHYLPTSKLAKEDGPYTSFFDKDIEEILAFFTPLKEAAEKHDVAIAQMHAPFPIWFKDKDELNDYIFMALEKCLAVCRHVGCPAIVVHPTQRSTKEKEHACNLDNYRRLIPAAKKYGVKICLENIFMRRPGRIQQGRCSNVEEACWYIDTLNKEAGGDYFGFCLDIGHANLTNRNLCEYIKELGDRLTILHIHDNNGLDDMHMIPYSYLATPTSHVCDWEGFVTGLKEIGYKGALAFETFRIFSAYPRAVWTEALKLIAAIGHYWAERIEE